MPLILRGTGFHHPLVMMVLTAATLATVLWIMITEEKKQLKKRKDVPKRPRTMLMPKVSFRDFNSGGVFDEEEEFETIVLEEWVDKYDGPSGAYTRRASFLPTESQSWPTLAQSYRPAAQQHWPRQPDRRPPVKSDPIAISSATSMFGDAGFFAALRSMGEVYGEIHSAGDASIVRRTDSAEFPRALKVKAGDHSRHEDKEDAFYDVPGLSMWKVKDEDVFYDVPGLSMWKMRNEDVFYDAPGLPMFLLEAKRAFYDAQGIQRWLRDIPPSSRHEEKEDVFYDVPGLSMWKMEDEDVFYDAPGLPLRDVPPYPVPEQQPGPVLEQRPLAALPMVVIPAIPPALTELLFAIRVLVFILVHSQGGAFNILVSPVQLMANRIAQRLIRIRSPYNH